MRRSSHVWFCNKDGINKRPSSIIPKEPDFIITIAEEWKEYYIEVIVFASVDMLFKHLNPLRSYLDK